MQYWHERALSLQYWLTRLFILTKNIRLLRFNGRKNNRNSKRIPLTIWRQSLSLSLVSSCWVSWATTEGKMHMLSLSLFNLGATINVSPSAGTEPTKRFSKSAGTKCFKQTLEVKDSVHFLRVLWMKFTHFLLRFCDSRQSSFAYSIVWSTIPSSGSIVFEQPLTTHLCGMSRQKIQLKFVDLKCSWGLRNASYMVHHHRHIFLLLIDLCCHKFLFQNVLKDPSNSV